MKALIVGGTGPTGPDVVAELLDRSYEVSILHRGTHEPDDEVLRRVEHIHADPHFADSLAAGLGSRTFDVIVGTYGRMRLVAAAAEGRCAQFIGVGGNPSQPGMLNRFAVRPSGMRILARESDPIVDGTDQSPRGRFAVKVARAEQTVLDAHARGAYSATYFRYPLVYGWRTWLQFERGIVRRVLDGRDRILLPDGGLGILTRCADRNAARHIGLALDHPEAAAGQVYTCGDDDQYSLVQWTELIFEALGRGSEIVGVPIELARTTWDLLPSGPVGSPHTVYDLGKARAQLGYVDVTPAKAALADVITRLVDHPSMDEVTYDRVAEDAVLAAYDDMRARLTDELGWDPVDDDEYFKSWHPYDHPDEPGRAGAYTGQQPPIESSGSASAQP